jgi:hypothetical protein
MLIEAIGNLFHNQSSRLGITPDRTDEITHRAEFQWNTIEEMFALKTVNSPFSESLTSAFRDIHSYKYLNDPTFNIALERRLTAIGIPTEERQKAHKCTEEIIKELGGEKFEEKHIGWHPNLAGIADVTRNANNRKFKNTTPFSGGGPAPDKNELNKNRTKVEPFKGEDINRSIGYVQSLINKLAYYLNEEEWVQAVGSPTGPGIQIHKSDISKVRAYEKERGRPDPKFQDIPAGKEYTNLPDPKAWADILGAQPGPKLDRSLSSAEPMVPISHGIRVPKSEIEKTPELAQKAAEWEPTAPEPKAAAPEPKAPEPSRPVTDILRPDFKPEPEPPPRRFPTLRDVEDIKVKEFDDDIDDDET